MSGREFRPPAFWSRLLEWAATRLGTPELADDAADLFAARSGRDGERAARRWYRRQALATLRPLLYARRAAWRGRVPGESPVSGRGGALVSLLDVKLGLRMLVKHPGLTVVGGFGIAVAIAIGAATFEFVSTLLDPALPVEQGNRVVALYYSTPGSDSPERRILHDFSGWRDELESVEQLSAYRDAGRNLAGGDGEGEPVRVAELTASGFRVARTPPLLGRTLVPEDEREGAPPVVVIGHGVWQSRFSGARDVVGSTIQLDGVAHTIVGVMPEGFRFPVDHQLWTALRADPSDHERLEGPAIHVFGRLAPGVTLDQAQAELSTVAQRTAAEHPGTHEWLRARVGSFTREYAGVADPMIALALRGLQLLVGMLLVVVAVNVAILVYARTVARLGEITVRSALGASRGRIVMQLFMESFVLSVAAAALGLLLARVALGRVAAYFAAEARPPYWVNFDLSAATVLYALALAVLAAIIAGVLPGLKATGRRLQSSLRELGGGTGTRLGRTWTFLIVAQVTVAVFFLPASIYMVWKVRPGVSDPGFPVERLLTARLELDRDYSSGAAGGAAAFRARVADRQNELARRLEAEPGVAAVAFSSRIPGNELPGRIEVDDQAPPSGVGGGLDVHTVAVTPDLVEAYDAEILAGRTLRRSDAGAGATVVIVNRAFAQRFLGSGTALGRRFRYTQIHPGQPELGPEGAWYEVVGVVEDFPAYPIGAGPSAEPTPTVYYPAAPGQLNPAYLSIRVEGAAPASLAGRLWKIAAEVDPALRVDGAEPLADFYDRARSGTRTAASVLALVTLSVLLLSAAGVSAMMSFTVALRTREIGIRVALGAPPHRILRGIFARVLRQLALGVGLGSLLGGGLVLGAGVPAGRAAVLLLAVAATILIVGLLAALGPARRGLGIQPIEALRAE